MIVKTKPYKHQTDAYNKLYGKEFAALFMEMGCGKSKVAIDIACSLFKEDKINAVMVIAPNGVHRQWADEQVPIHCSVDYSSWVWSLKKSRLHQTKQEDFLLYEDPRQRLKWFYINVEVFQTKNYIKTFAEFLINHRCMMIVDESTRIKNPKANRTINICYNLARKKKQGKRIISVDPLAKYRLILTGTMITNSPYDLWSMFEFLKHNYFDLNWYAFKARYGIEIRDVHPGTNRSYTRSIKPSEIISIRKYHIAGKDAMTIAMIMGTSESNIQYIIDNPGLMSPYKRLDELKKKIADDSFIIRKTECLDLPPKIYERLYVDMNTEQKRIYNELKKRLLSTYDEHELTVLNKVSLIGRLQQVTGGFFPYKEMGTEFHHEWRAVERTKIVPIGESNPKLKVLIRDLEETDEVVIIWARCVAELKLIKMSMDKHFPERRSELYYGGTNKETRAQLIRDFKEGKIDCLIANQRTAGMGLNLQRSHFHYFYSNSYSLEDRLQAEDRSHRHGQESTVLYKDLIVRGTVDEQVHEVLERKQNLLEYFRDHTLESFLGESKW